MTHVYTSIWNELVDFMKLREGAAETTCPFLRTKQEDKANVFANRTEESAQAENGNGATQV
jgi:hypothetical protein